MPYVKLGKYRTLMVSMRCLLIFITVIMYYLFKLTLNKEIQYNTKKVPLIVVSC